MEYKIYNPYGDGIPARIWELLRRNQEFGAVVKELMGKAAPAEESDTDEGSQES